MGCWNDTIRNAHPKDIISRREGILFVIQTFEDLKNEWHLYEIG